MITGGFFVNTVTINRMKSKNKKTLDLFISLEDFYAEKNTTMERQRTLWKL